MTGSLLFVIFINYLPDVIQNASDVYVYADDTEVCRKIRTPNDCEILQEDIDAMRA